ncbi:hypothetical protein DERP_000173 [Dermatophagoides pteronyssinus]|uniref:Uncharacterized protein n=1 Tax=Dermatophagoides pteronyssinus TaxID=6956 RepID=A0ABQ8IZF7_DERPT|nr:hypothetical protein DERP_000173 [Dermatophagoides pteronyssinus]
MDARTEINYILKTLLVDLKENFSEEFDQMKLYRNVAFIEKKGGQLLEKFNGIMDKVVLQLNSRVEAIQREDKLEQDLIMNDGSSDVLMKIITDMNKIEKLNEAILETTVKNKAIDEKKNDLKQALEILNSEPLKTMDQLLQQIQQTLE